MEADAVSRRKDAGSKVDLDHFYAVVGRRVRQVPPASLLPEVETFSDEELETLLRSRPQEEQDWIRAVVAGGAPARHPPAR